MREREKATIYKQKGYASQRSHRHSTTLTNAIVPNSTPTIANIRAIDQLISSFIIKLAYVVSPSVNTPPASRDSEYDKHRPPGAE